MLLKKHLHKTVILALGLLFIGLLYFVILRNTEGFKYDLVNIAPNATVTVYQTQSGFIPERGGSPRSLNDNNHTSWWYGNVDGNTSNWIELEWTEPKVIDKVIINFGRGNRYAVDYKIQTWNGKQWDDRIVITGNYSDPVTHFYSNDKEGVATRQLRLYITKTKGADHLQEISEFYVYDKQETDLSNILVLYLFKPIKELFAYLGYSFLFLIIFFIPGYVLLNYFLGFLTYEEKFALSFAVTIFVILILTVFCLVIKFLDGLYFFPFCFIYAFFMFVQKKQYLELKYVEKPLVVTLILAVTFKVFYNLLIDKLGFRFQADYLIPWGVAKVFMYNLKPESFEALNYLFWWHISDRTPLLGITSIPFLKIFGDRLFIFQMVSIVSASLFFSSFFVLVRRLFGQKIAIIALLFFLINPYSIYGSTREQYRWFTTYFVFLYMYFLLAENKLKNRNWTLLAGFCAGLSYMAHPVSLLYIAGGLLYVLLRNYSFKHKVINITRILSVLAIFIVPWMLWCIFYASIPVFYLFPFSTQGDGQTLSNPGGIIQTFLRTSFREVLMIRIWNFLGTFLYDPKSGIHSIIDINFYTCTLTGAITLTLIFFSFYGFGKGLFQYTKEICCFICVPIISQVIIVSGWYEPRRAEQLQPIIPLLVALGIYGSWQFKNVKLIFILYNFYLLEHIFVLWWLKYPARNIFIDALDGDTYLLISSYALLLWYLGSEFLVYKYLIVKDKNKYT